MVARAARVVLEDRAVPVAREDGAAADPCIAAAATVE